MIIHTVKFETTLSDAEVRKVAESRAGEFRKLTGLVQKYYLKYEEPNHYGAVYIWNSPESLQAYRSSDLLKTIATAYKIKGTPRVEVNEVLFPLRQG